MTTDKNIDIQWLRSGSGSKPDFKKQIESNVELKQNLLEYLFGKSYFCSKQIEITDLITQNL